jgi:ATP-binding cassette subfamily F protein 3
VILISHDPHIIELTADRFWLIENGRVQPFEGDLADYRGRLLAQREVRDRDTVKSAPRKDENRLSAPPRPSRPSKKRIEQAEALATRLHGEVAALHKSLADPALYTTVPDRLLAIQKELREKEQALAEAEAVWLSLQEQWEAAAG